MRSLSTVVTIAPAGTEFPELILVAVLVPSSAVATDACETLFHSLKSNRTAFVATLQTSVSNVVPAAALVQTSAIWRLELPDATTLVATAQLALLLLSEIVGLTPLSAHETSNTKQFPDNVGGILIFSVVKLFVLPTALD